MAVLTARPGKAVTADGRLALIIGSALLMQTLNATVIANALPTIARSFGQSPLTLNLAITVYLLAGAVFLPISGWIADRYGARRTFRIAIFGYTLACALCGLSRSLPELLLARGLAGACGAMLSPVGRLVLLRSVERSNLVHALSFLTIPAMLGPVIGPPIGGLIVTFGSWRWIFLMNVPVGIVASLLAARHVPDVRAETMRTLDMNGFILSALALAGLVFGLQNLDQKVLPPVLSGLIFAAVLGLGVLYVRHERRTPHAILSLDLFKTYSFTAGVLGGQFTRMLTGAAPFLLTLLFQVGFGLSAWRAGLLTLINALGALAMKASARRSIRLFGLRNLLIVNTVITALAFMAFDLFRPNSSYVAMIAVLAVGGFFRSLQFTALNALAFCEVGPGDVSQASTISGMALPLAQSLGVASSAALVHALSAGRSISLDALHMTFFVMGAGSLLAVPFFVLLPGDAGAEVSGHAGLRARIPG